MKALGRPGRCGLLRERSRIAGLQPADAIGRGASSGAQALRSSRLASNSVVKRRIERSRRRARIRQPFAVSKGIREIHAGKMRFGWLARTALFFALLFRPQILNSCHFLNFRVHQKNFIDLRFLFGLYFFWFPRRSDTDGRGRAVPTRKRKKLVERLRTNIRQS